MPESALFGIAGQVATGLLNNAISQGNAHDQRDWQQQMWAAQNNYNDPGNMAARMRAAGLNPYTMTDAQPAGSAGTGAMAQTFPLENPLLALKTIAEVENLNASTGRTESETDKILKEISLLDIAYERGLISNEDYERKVRAYWKTYEDKSEFDLQREATEAGISNTTSDTALKDAQGRLASATADAYDEARADGVNEFSDAHNLIVQQIEESDQRIISMINSDKREDQRLGIQLMLANLEKIRTSAEVRLMKTEEDRNNFYNKCILPIQRQIESLRKQNLISENAYKQAQAEAVSLETQIKQGDAQGFVTYFNHYLNATIGAARVAVDAFL